ncbi:acyl dehydratase [Pukyongiella litopenaei]|uniref:Acyl dehydratase n=1 Tax=Pukyongiella litopenaei TaxID=2605946 RepID=A0A2S0MSM9_9RHOB|nr:acyl dehydratase [Pukyongiella litopenaei]AVO38895.1 acyl dehydratase [Pukyongiella litopenaei]
MKQVHTASETRSDLIDPARARAFQAALGREPDIEAGMPLPPFFHQLYFWAVHPPDGLGRDGHPKLGGLIPDLGLPRRMWAGGRLRFAMPLRAGAPADRLSVVESAEHKHGRSGPLGFVTLRHEIRQGGELCLTEWQELVYRQDPHRDAPRPLAPVARTDETDAREIAFDSTLLFRYSALTFNGHRIHYDLDYARDVEGYDGLVVHGPLLAQQLMLLAGDLMGPLGEFSFRAASPLMHFETGTCCRNGPDLWVRGPDGRLVMSATATPVARGA